MSFNDWTKQNFWKLLFSLLLGLLIVRGFIFSGAIGYALGMALGYGIAYLIYLNQQNSITNKPSQKEENEEEV